MKARIAAGGFARVTLDEATTFTGYLAADPGLPGRLRMDGCVFAPDGHLEQISIRLEFEDIRHIEFLPEAPEFIDAEGHSYRMPAEFFRHLD